MSVYDLFNVLFRRYIYIQVVPFRNIGHIFNLQFLSHFAYELCACAATIHLII